MHTSISTFSSSDEIIENYLYAESAPIRANVDNAFVAVRNNQKEVTELLSVSPDNKLINFYRDPHSKSGWNHTEVTINAYSGQEIQKIVAFFEADCLYVFVHYPGKDDSYNIVPMKRTAGQWSELVFSGDLGNALLNTFQTDIFYDWTACKNYLYGVSHNYDIPTFFVIALEGGEFKIECRKALEQNPAPTVRLLYGVNGESLTVAEFLEEEISFQAGEFVDGSFKPSGKAWTYSLVKETLNASNVLAFPSESNLDCFFLHTKENSLYVIKNYSSQTPQSHPLIGSDGGPQGVTALTTGLACNGLAVVFAIEAVAGNLWLLRQTGWEVDKQPIFANWVNLGNQVSVVATPEKMGVGPEVFHVEVGSRTVNHLDQNPDSTVWYPKTLASPTPPTQVPKKAVTYDLVLTLEVEHGRPLPKQIVQMDLDRSSIVDVNGLAYHIEAGKPVDIESDAIGNLNITFEATELTAPLVKLSYIDDAGNHCHSEYRADGNAHARLANQDPKSPMNAQTLKDLKIIPNKVPDSKADKIASAVTTLGGLMAQHKSSGNQPQSWHFDFSQKDIGIDTYEGQRVFDFIVPAHELSVIDGGNIFGDLLHYLDKDLKDLEKIATAVVDDVVHIVLHVKGEIKKFALKSVDKIGAFLKLVLKKIVEGFKEVIDVIEAIINWLKRLFDWQNILNTQQVIKHFFNGFLDLAQSKEKYIQRQVSQGVSWLDSDFKTLLMNTKKFLGDTGSFSNSMQTKKGVVDVKEQKKQATAHVCRQNYVLRHVNAHIKNKSMVKQGGGIFSSVEAELKKIISQPSWKKALLQSQEYFTSLLSKIN
ncbi:hypothetical protein D1BOALGB6SA_9076 [Olavius sp. associated proteobacterium Delta 1]|nr:hypothetical protein D1BOALGB6SA_9076 [Olavius sp. associated proteobacterium Delta 1]